MTRYKISGDTKCGKIRDVVLYDMCVDMRLLFDTKCGVIPSMKRYEIWGDT